MPSTYDYRSNTSKSLGNCSMLMAPQTKAESSYILQTYKHKQGRSVIPSDSSFQTWAKTKSSWDTRGSWRSNPRSTGKEDGSTMASYLSYSEPLTRHEHDSYHDKSTKPRHYAPTRYTSAGWSPNQSIHQKTRTSHHNTTHIQEYFQKKCHMNSHRPIPGTM
jgi:hypothetical protein